MRGIESGITSYNGAIRSSTTQLPDTHLIFQYKEHPVPANSSATPSTTDFAIDQRALDEVALTREEYERIVSLLGRAPNRLELGLFGAMWSEHCGYKNSRPLLKLFPTAGSRVLLKAGA